MVQSTEVNISEEDSHNEEEEGDDIEEYTRIIKGNAIETCVEDEILGSSSKINMRDLAEEMTADEVLLGCDNDTDDDECRDARRKFNNWHDKENAKVDGIVKLIIQTPNPTLGGGSTEPWDVVSEYEDSNVYANTPGESEEDDIRGKESAPIIDEHTDFSKLVWQLGMRFPNRELFRDAV
ncbi:unnamed protein product [Cuscuta campestris]|uniref:Uncharacterized protein n=1 Tax=Cuscuta campestris TaxID=132261 RepID=A0A484N8P6_9ASTE|nr:unnamed protein product [Cuscuta campestris]